MSPLQFLAEIANLLLKSEEGTKDWLKVKALRHSWYVFFALGLALLALHFLVWPLESFLSSSASATLALRVAQLVLGILMHGSLSVLAFRYYGFALSKNAAIKLGNVLNFYCISIWIFALIYQSVYVIDQRSFVYLDPAFQIGPTLGTHTFFENWKMKIDFLLFSGFQTVSSSFYKIQAQSTWVSVITYAQGLSTFGLVALFVASYVNQRTNRQDLQAS